MVFTFSCAASPAKDPNRPITKQRAINPFAHLLQRRFAQSEELSVKDGKGVEERESDDLYPQQRYDRDGMVMGAMGQMPMLG